MNASPAGQSASACESIAIRQGSQCSAFEAQIEERSCHLYLYNIKTAYDGLTAHVSMVFVRYMLLAVLKRDEEDARTIGELFFLTVSEVAEMTYRESLLILPAAMLTSM